MMDKETNSNQSNDFWQAEVLGQIYETNLSELGQWITEGAVMPTDKVKRGNLRWIEAGKIPLLLPFFNAKESGIEPPIQTNYTHAENTTNENYSETRNFAPISDNLNQTENQYSNQNNFAPQSEKNLDLPVSDFCILHPENESRFHCETCGNAFCPQCPKSYGGNGKNLPDVRRDVQKDRRN